MLERVNRLGKTNIALLRLKRNRLGGWRRRRDLIMFRSPLKRRTSATRKSVLAEPAGSKVALGQRLAGAGLQQVVTDLPVFLLVCGVLGGQAVHPFAASLLLGSARHAIADGIAQITTGVATGRGHGSQQEG